jgi:ComF family protein
LERNYIEAKKRAIKKIGSWVINLIYPQRCPGCETILDSDKSICNICRTKIIYIEEPTCKKCGKPLENEIAEFCYDCIRKEHVYDSGKAVFAYQGVIKESLYRFKYSDKRDYAYFYAAETVERYGGWIKNRGIDAIVPIPLHKKRKKQRGYNQAELYARFLGDLMDLPVYTKMLVRLENTKPQKNLNDTERKNNLKKAFKYTGNIVQSKCILLVDDIYTTGSTMDAAAEELKVAGVQKVYFTCVSIGRGL